MMSTAYGNARGNTFYINTYKFLFVQSSVGDPDPDPHVFGPPGSGSGSISQRYGSGSGSGSFHFLIKVLSRVQRFWLPQNGVSQAVDGCQIKLQETFLIYVFGSFEPFRPLLALKTEDNVLEGKL
jgi:hypothetical protein